VWSYNPESYAGGSVATGRAPHAEQVKDDDPDKKGYPDLRGWKLSLLLAPSPRKEP
jgi:hypothetical protein